MNRTLDVDVDRQPTHPQPSHWQPSSVPGRPTPATPAPGECDRSAPSQHSPGGHHHGKELAAGAAVGVSAVLVVALVVVASVVAIRFSVRLASDRLDAESIETYTEAVALESGVRPLVSDRVGELGEVTAVEVRRTPDLNPARIHLLAPRGEDRPRLSVMSDPELTTFEIDGFLADGRPYAVYNSEGPYVSLATLGANGQYVEVMGRDITFDNLLFLTVDIGVTLAALDRMPAGWTELGTTPMPPWHHGFDTSYDFLGGRRLGITVERATPGRAALAAFTTTEPVDLGTGGWAYRFRPPSSGVIFERGDVVVRLNGDFSDVEFLIVAHSLREMAPDEHPIFAPQY